MKQQNQQQVPQQAGRRQNHQQVPQLVGHQQSHQQVGTPAGKREKTPTILLVPLWKTSDI